MATAALTQYSTVYGGVLYNRKDLFGKPLSAFHRMENTAKLGLFAVHKIVSEYAERLYAYMEKKPRATKLCISQLIIIQILKFFRFLLSTLYGA